jgi:hypothetical protein
MQHRSFIKKTKRRMWYSRSLSSGRVSRAAKAEKQKGNSMSEIFYAAVHGDPLTSGKGSQVYAYGKVGAIVSEDGVRRQMAFIGDDAWCVACGSMGRIIGGARVSDKRRMYDAVRGRRQAVGGDQVLCACETLPQIIAIYGRKWRIHDEQKMADVARSPSQNNSKARADQVHDESFTLINSDGKPLPNVRYRVRIGTHVIVCGATNSSGQTQRIVTSGSANLIFEIEQ